MTVKRLHLTFFPPLKGARFDTNARWSLTAWGDVIVCSSYQVCCRVYSIANKAHRWICSDSATLVRFPKIIRAVRETVKILLNYLFNSRFLLLLLFYVVSENDSHVRVSCEVIRIYRCQVIAHGRVVVWRTQITTWGMRGRGVEWRHAVKKISFVDISRVTCMILVYIWKNLRVFFPIAYGAGCLNDVWAFRIVMSWMLLKLLSEGNRSLK